MLKLFTAGQGLVPSAAPVGVQDPLGPVAFVVARVMNWSAVPQFATVGLVPVPPMNLLESAPAVENARVPKSRVVGATVMHGVAAAWAVTVTATVPVSA